MKYFRYILWGVAGLSLLWDFVDFVHDLIEAAEPDSYQTNYDAVSMFISGVIHTFQWIFYAELYHLLYTFFVKSSKEKKM